MTVFGRDTLITCLQTLLFGPELARTALDALAELQATRGRPSIDAEPGKIVHEVRRGKAAQNWFAATTAPSTRRRSTSSCSPRSGAGPTTRRSSRELQGAGAGGAALDRRVRRPRRRRLRRVRAPHAARARGPVVEGLAATRSASTTARSPSAPIAPCEVQGYVYDAKLRDRRARARGLARPRARRPARARGGGAAPRASTSAFWVEDARRLLRARARRREAAGRLALLEHRPPALERDRPGRARRRDRRPAAWARSSGRAGACGRCRPATPATTRSRTTTARSGLTTTP